MIIFVTPETYNVVSLFKLTKSCLPYRLCLTPSVRAPPGRGGGVMATS